MTEPGAGPDQLNPLGGTVFSLKPNLPDLRLSLDPRHV